MAHSEVEWKSSDWRLSFRRTSAPISCQSIGMKLRDHQKESPKPVRSRHADAPTPAYELTKLGRLRTRLIPAPAYCGPLSPPDAYTARCLRSQRPRSRIPDVRLPSPPPSSTGTADEDDHDHDSREPEGDIRIGRGWEYVLDVVDYDMRPGLSRGSTDVC